MPLKKNRRATAIPVRIDDATSLLQSSHRLLEHQQANLLARESMLEHRLFWLDAMINSIPASLYAKDAEGRFIIGNRQTWSSHGLAAEESLIGKTDFDLHARELAQKSFDLDQEVLSSGKPLLGIEEDIVCDDGRDRCLLTSRIPVRGADGALAGIVGFSYDISDRKAAETLMLGQANMFGMVARSLPLEEIVTSIILMIEEQLPGLIGSVQMLSADGRHLLEAIAPNLPPAYKTLIDGTIVGPAAASNGTAAWSGETVIAADILTDPLWAGYAEQASPFGIRSSWSTPVLSYQGEVLGTFSFYTSSVSVPTSSQSDLIAMASYMIGIAVERKQSEARIHFLAHHDSLTGLPNRSTFDERLTQALEQAQAQGGLVMLAFLDLDHFKLINDSLGHEAGDQLLKTIADRAKKCLRTSSDVIARMGGDEFVVLLTGQRSEQDAVLQQLHALQNAVSMPVTLCGRSLQTTFSMGVACFPEHGETSTALLANADIAMYRAKSSGRANIKMFSLEMAALSNAKLFNHQELRNAIADDQFVLYYQPQVDLESGRIFAVESLVRWLHPERGLVPPGEFIPLAEETGLIVQIGNWVLKTACAQNRAWQDAGLAPIVMSVNVSARQFLEKDWALCVAEALQDTGLDAQYLELELTESMLMEDLPKAKAMLAQLSALGVKLAIDDFGTGYSSLSALKSFPVGLLKIDRSFVKDIPDDEDDMAITGAIISLAQKLALRVIAEGVETQAQVDFLRRSGCNEVQGYFFSRPVQAQQLASLLAQAEGLYSPERGFAEEAV